jgi:small-conductance mechanosensitive channel
MFRRPLHRADLDADGEPLSRLKASGLSALVALLGMAAAPVATLAVLALLNAFDLVPPRVEEISQGLVLAVCIVAIGRGLLQGALAPGEPRRRVVPVSDEMAGLIYRNAALGLWILATTALLNTIHKALVVPVPLTVATAATMALALVLVAGRTMRALSELSDGDETEGKADEATSAGPSATALQWIRFPFWILNATIVAALVAGYVSVATFLASRSLVAVVMAGALYLIIALINAVFIDGIASGPRARHVAKTLGVRPASLELLALLVAGVFKALATLVVLVMVIGTFGTSTADIRDLVGRITFGFTIGTSTITLGDVLSAVMFMVIGIVVARAIQRWFAVAILPKTSFDQGLQNSISTIIGYVGSIAVIAMAMGQLGLNLENIALVAGALSVGIGFGLQSIVSNFVSGLILLAERPIRVGDTINVKGEEGYVRRISVRATEIETFDRAAVLIPNSDLITGMVKNFTHANTTGRVIVAVNVAYDADADEVRDILIGCACDHPQVLRSPPPRVFLMAFGDSYLKFELRCVVANVDYALTVKSDLHFAVLDRMKAAKIGIPYTPWAVYRGGRIGPDEPTGDDGG